MSQENDEKEKMICPICGKEYTLKRYYDKHIKGHEEKDKKKAEHKEKIEKQLNEKVKEVNEKQKEYEEKKDKLSPKDDEFWMRFWATLEGISSQNAMILGALENIEKNTNIEKETKIRLESLIGHALKSLDKTNEITELIANTPAVVLKDNQVAVIDEGKKVESAPISKKAQERTRVEEEIITTSDGVQIEQELTPMPGSNNNAFGNTSGGFTDNEFKEVKEKAINNAKKEMTKSTPVNNFDEEKEYQIEAEIKGSTQKALLLTFNIEGQPESWVPKSTVKSSFRDEKNIKQYFVIDKWILKKNGIIF